MKQMFAMLIKWGLSSVRYSCALVVSVLLLSAARAEDNRFDPQHLKTFKTALLDAYPQTVCVLKAALGTGYVKLRDYERDSGEAGGGGADFEPDGDDGSVVQFDQYYQNDDNRILYVHPDGTVLLGLKRGAKLILYSNTRALQKSLPPQVRAWMAANQGDHPDIVWHVPQREGLDFPQACSWSTLATQIAGYVDGTQVRACKLENLKYMGFSQLPAFIPAGRRRVPLLGEPKPPQAAGQGPYLVPGDLVELAEKDSEIAAVDGYACAFYQGTSGKVTMGWVPVAAVHQVADDDSAALDAALQQLPETTWLKHATHRLNYPGRDKEDQEQHSGSFALAGKAAFKVSDIDESVTGTSNFENAETKWRILRAMTPTLEASAYLFNNAVFVHVKSEGLHHWGVYYP